MNDRFASTMQRKEPIPQQQRFTANQHFPSMENSSNQQHSTSSKNSYNTPNSVTAALQPPPLSHRRPRPGLGTTGNYSSRNEDATTAITMMRTSSGNSDIPAITMELGNGTSMIRSQQPYLSKDNDGNHKMRNEERLNLVGLLAPTAAATSVAAPQPLSRSSSLGSLLDWDTSMTNQNNNDSSTTPLPLHPKRTVSNTMNINHNNNYYNNNNSATNSGDMNSYQYPNMMTTQSESSSNSYFDFAPLPFHESSQFDGNTLSFLTSIRTSNGTFTGITTTNHHDMNLPHSSNALTSTTGSAPGLTSDTLSPAVVNMAAFPTPPLKRKTSQEESVHRHNSKDQASDENVNRCSVHNYNTTTNYESIKVARIHQEQYSGNLLMRSNASTTTAAATMPSRKIKTTDMAASLLHNTCKLFPTSLSVIESAVQFDPEAIHTAIPTFCSTKHLPGTSVSHDFNKHPPPQYSPTSSTAAIRNVYSFPLNIALQYNASMDVIAFLVQLYPNVLTKVDGPNQTGSLSIALSSINLEEVEKDATDANSTAVTKSTDGNGNLGTLLGEMIGKTEGTRIDQLVRMFVLANPDCVKVVDRRKNTALHYLAKRQGDISCASISLVYQLYPDALNRRNCLGQTPVQVAQRNPTITDQLLDHWYELSYRQQELTLEKSLIQIDHELDESNQKTGPMNFGPAHDLPLGGCGSGGTSASCTTRSKPTTTTTTSTKSTIPMATKAANASAYFVPSVLASSKKNYDKRNWWQYETETILRTYKKYMAWDQETIRWFCKLWFWKK